MLCRCSTHHPAAILQRGSSAGVILRVWVCTSPEAHKVSNVSGWEAVMLHWGVLGNISRKRTIAQVQKRVLSRCFEGCLVQARNNYSNRSCGLRNNASDVRPTDAAGVKPPSQTLAPDVSRGASCWCVRLLLAKNVQIYYYFSLDNNRQKFPSSFRGMCSTIVGKIRLDWIRPALRPTWSALSAEFKEKSEHT